MRQSTFMGRPRWQLVLGIVFIAQLMTAIGFSMVFPFLPLYVTELGSTTGLSVEILAGLVIGVQGFTMMVASPLWGAVADRYGRKMMSMRALFGGAVIVLLMGFARNAEDLILLRAIQGLVTGTVAANAALVAAAVPREHVGFSMGTLQVGLWGGIAAGPLLGGVMADAFGFSVPFIVTAICLFLSGVLIYFGVHEDFDREKVKNDTERPGLIEQWKHVVSAPGVSYVYLMRFLESVGRQMIIPIAPIFVISLLPLDAAQQSIYAGLLISVSSAASTFSGVYLGRLGDRIGHRQILITCSVLATIFYVPQVFVADVGQLVLLQGLSGLAAGGIVSSASALLAKYTEPGEEGAVYGIDNSIVAGARAIAPLSGGAIAAMIGARGTFAATALLFFGVSILAWRVLPENLGVRQQTMPATAAGD